MNVAWSPRTAALTLDVPDRIVARTLLEDWAERPGVSLNIVRARVTPDSATYELEVRGSAADVAEILRQGAPWSASRRGYPQVLAHAFA